MSDVLIPVAVSYPGLDRLLDGRYQVIQILDRGAWGRTYLAQDTRRPSQPECVIQHILPVIKDSAYQTAFKHLFVREAATLERLGEHRQIPRLLACFENEQGFHLVQEFISGDSLALDLLPGQSWHEERVLQLLLDCLEPLAAVHRECCRHGDVRPDNLIRRSQDGKLVLTNFGTVRDVHLSLLTLHGQIGASMVPNTQGYQSPEQVQGLPCLASDVYAVGLLGIQALTGIHPTQLTRIPQTGEILWHPFDEIAGSTLRHGLVAVLSRMVRADQTQRYGSAGEALQALRQLTQAVSPNVASQGVLPQGVLPQEATDPSIALLVAQTTSQILAPVDTPTQATLAEKRVSPAVHIGVGIGAVLAAAVCGYALPLLLDRTIAGESNQGNQPLMKARQYQAGWFQNTKRSTPAELAAAQHLREAYGHAIAKNFAGAIASLKQIPAGTAVSTKAQEKLHEYSEKQQIQAVSYLQTAYNQAEAKEFDQALESLTQISTDTQVYAKAQAKKLEYTEKQRIRTEALATSDLNPGSHLREANVSGR